MTNILPLDGEAQKQFDLGWQLFISNDYSDAREYFLKAIQRSPNSSQVYLGLGHSFFHQRQPDLAGATRAYRRVVDLSPDWSEGHYCLGTAQDKQGQLREAVDSFETATRLAPDDPRPRISLGVCLTRLKDYGAAITCLRNGIALKPQYGEASAHLFLAEVLSLDGQIEAACEEWRLILGMPSEYPDYKYPQKEASQMLKKYETKGR
jgi:tetratricopeptide (TPR) repeat protein